MTTTTTTNTALLALADRWEKIAADDGKDTLSGSVHTAFANELRRTLAAPSAGNAPPQVEYDRGLIAEMLEASMDFGALGNGYKLSTVQGQIDALRAADDRDAAGVYTGRASEAGDWVLVPRVPTKEMCRAGLAERHDDLAKSIYAAMIAAAPAPGGG